MASRKAAIGNKLLRRLRVEEKGWSKEELGRKADVSAQTVRKAERGLAISEISRARIAKALGTETDKLFPDSAS
jgi:transcriptional regulator with XRE-family HTH domain